MVTKPRTSPFAQLLLLFRTTRGLSQHEVGAKLGMNQSSYQRVETGASLPSKEFVDKIARDGLGLNDEETEQLLDAYVAAQAARIYGPFEESEAQPQTSVAGILHAPDIFGKKLPRSTPTAQSESLDRLQTKFDCNRAIRLVAELLNDTELSDDQRAYVLHHIFLLEEFKNASMRTKDDET